MRRLLTSSKSLAQNPDCAERHTNLGNLLKEQGKLDAATAHYERALANKPDLAECITIAPI